MSQSTMTEIFGDVISQYTRADALEDGQLVDVSDLAKDAGFRFPVAVTNAVMAKINDIPKTGKWSCEDATGRLWDLLTMAKYKAVRSEGSEFLFNVIMHTDPDGRKFRQIETFIAQVGPGDNLEPVITIQCGDGS